MKKKRLEGEKALKKMKEDLSNSAREAAVREVQNGLAENQGILKRR